LSANANAARACEETVEELRTQMLEELEAERVALR
jgi:hypothetical protein